MGAATEITPERVALFRRILAAQEPVHANALAELAAGRKQTHWMWFVFPILAGLRESPTSARYAIPDVDAARAYLGHELLRARLVEVVNAAGAQLKLDVDPATLLGSDIDAQKLVSCTTLFAHAAEDDDLAGVFARVRDAAIARGVARCAFTEAAIARA